MDKNLFDNEFLSYLGFLKIIYRLSKNPNIILSYNASATSPENYLSVLKTLQDERILKIIKNEKIEFRRTGFKDLFFERPSKKEIFEKLLEKLSLKEKFNRDKKFLSDNMLIRQFASDFQNNIDYFQFPCSILSSMKRTSRIIRNLLLKTQNLLFLGDDDLVSVLCKIITPEIEIHIIDIDKTVIGILEEISNEFKFNKFYIHNLDLNKDNQEFEFLANRFSMIHTDPPYVPEFLKHFLEKAIFFGNDKFYQIFLNGLFNLPCSHIINEFQYKNKLICSGFYKSFNNYPVVSMDMQYINWIREHVKLYFQYDFTEEQIRETFGTSDLYIFEKGYIWE